MFQSYELRTKLLINKSKMWHVQTGFFSNTVHRDKAVERKILPETGDSFPTESHNAVNIISDC